MATAEHDNAPPAFRLQAKLRAFKTPASVIPEPEMLGIVLEMSGYQAWRRGCANRRPNGSIVQTKGNCHLDHLNLVGKAGASHQITNGAPLCPCHNLMKRDRQLHLEDYRRAIRQNGEMMVSDVSEPHAYPLCHCEERSDVAISQTEQRLLRQRDCHAALAMTDCGKWVRVRSRNSLTQKPSINAATPSHERQDSSLASFWLSYGGYRDHPLRMRE